MGMAMQGPSVIPCLWSLDTPDVALWGQRLMAYGERLCREEEQITQESGRARPNGQPHRPLIERLVPEARVRRPRTPLLIDWLADAEGFAQPQQQRGEPAQYREPRDAPEVGRRPVDIGAPHQPQRREPARPAMSPPQYVEVPVYDDQYGLPAGPRYTTRPAPLMQHRLAKLDVLKGEIREKLDDFIFQVKEFATFHVWDPVETCKQDQTHLMVIALAYIRQTPLPPRDWTELQPTKTSFGPEIGREAKIYQLM